MDSLLKDTIKYYDENAAGFSADTLNVEFSDMQNRFLSCVKEDFPGISAGDIRLLDFGCGAGRDVRYFSGAGFSVDAVDGSSELCRIVKEETGVDAKNIYFQDFNETGKYNGIWACASLLHLKSEELGTVIKNLEKSLVPGGILYVSFKYGDFEGMRNGRYFTDMTEDRFMELVSENTELETTYMWITEDVRKGREGEKWLNVLLRKNS